MDRPVLLTLQRPGERPALVALVGLGEHQATLMVDGQPRALAVADLARVWRGEFTTFWRPPPGYAVRNENVLPLRTRAAGVIDIRPGKRCPECGNHAVIRKDGCDFCSACGAVGGCG